MELGGRGRRRERGLYLVGNDNGEGVRYILMGCL